MDGRARAVGRWLFAFTLSAYLATAGGSMATDPMSYEVARSLVEHGSVALSYQVLGLEAHRGIDGRYYAPYGIGHALYNVPFYLVGRALERWTGLDVRKPEAVRKAVVVLGSAVAAAATVWVTFLFAHTVVSSVQAAVATALTLGFATLLWPYAKFGFNAPLATLCLVAGAFGGWRAAHGGGVGALFGAGAGVGGALLVRHELILGALPVVALLWLAGRDASRTLFRRLCVFALPVVAAILVTFAYNAARFGNPLDTGYLRDETATFGSIQEGLVGLLFSPGRSLFLYSPVVLASVLLLPRLWRTHRAFVVLCAGEAAVLLLFYASLEYWDADRSYGPRYLVPALPFLVLPLAFWFDPGGDGRRSHEKPSRRLAASDGEPEFRRRARLALSTLVALSVLVQVPGVLVDFSKVGYTPQVGYHSLEERRWKWQLAGVALNTRAAVAAIPENFRYLAGTAVPPTIRPGQIHSRDFSEQFAFSLDFWWLYLFYLGAISAPVAAGLGLLSFALAGACTWQLRRRLVAASAPHRVADGPRPKPLADEAWPR